MCAEFRVRYTPSLIQSEVTPNADIVSVSLGDLELGISVCYTTCQYDWHWIYLVNLFSTSPGPGHAEILPHPDTGLYQIANCLEGYPVEPVEPNIGLYVNDPCPPEP
jgi:hypothetical protein